MAGSAGVWSWSNGAAADRGRARVVGWARAAPGGRAGASRFSGGRGGLRFSGWRATFLGLAGHVFELFRVRAVDVLPKHWWGWGGFRCAPNTEGQIGPTHGRVQSPNPAKVGRGWPGRVICAASESAVCCWLVLCLDSAVGPVRQSWRVNGASLWESCVWRVVPGLSCAVAVPNQPIFRK